MAPRVPPKAHRRSVGAPCPLSPRNIALGSASLAALLFLNTLNADFVYDDRRAVLENPDVRPGTSFTRLLADDFWGIPLSQHGSHGSYRPLTVLGFRAVRWAAGGLMPRAFHGVNVALHASMTGLFSLLTLETGTPPRAAALAAALFASHPVHCEAVAAVVGAADIEAGLLSLAALLAARRRRVPLAVLLATGSLLCKESGLLTLAVVAACELAAAPSSREKRSQHLRDGVLPILVGLGFLSLLRAQVSGLRVPEFASSDNPAAECPHLLTRLLTFCYLPAFHSLLLLWPRQLSFDWSMEAVPLVTSLWDRRNLLSFCLYATLGGFLLRIAVLRRRHVELGLMSSRPDVSLLHSIVLGLSLLVCPFLPATNLLFYVGFVVAERILYLPSAGFCLLMAIGWDLLYRRFVGIRRLLMFSAVLLVMVFCIRTVVRNQDWQTEEALYRAGISVNPPKAYGNLGSILAGKGRRQEAEWAYRKALSYRFNMADVHYNLGNLLQEDGRLEEALSSYRLAIHFRPRLAMAHLNLGLTLERLGLKENAIETLRHAAGLDGSGTRDPRRHEEARTSALCNLGRLLANSGRNQEAVEIYLEAVNKMPDDYEPQAPLYNLLGEVYGRLQRFPEAERWHRLALRASPAHLPARLTYARLLAQWDRPNDAEREFWVARNLAPNDSSVHHHYGHFLREQQRVSEAADSFIQAALLSPDHYHTILTAADTLRQASRHIEAERYFRMAVELRPNEVSGHLNLGALLHLTGRHAEAEIAYRTVLRLRPGDPTALTNLQRLQSRSATSTS